MKINTSKARSLTAALITFGSLVGGANAAVTVIPELISSDAGSHTFRFTFTGDMGGVSSPSFLSNFLFINYDSSTALYSALPTSVDINSFANNTVGRNDSGLIDVVETREDDNIFNRVSFRFDSDFEATDSFNVNSTIDVVFPTVAAIAASDFYGLPLYWGLGPDPNNSYIGPNAGQITPVPEPSSALLLGLGALALVLNVGRTRRRS